MEQLSKCICIATHPSAKEARLQELLFPGVERRLEMLHLHSSACNNAEVTDICIF